MLPKWIETRFGFLDRIGRKKCQIIFTSDTNDIYYDDNTGNRHIMAKDIVIVNTLKALSNILVPLSDKLYFVKSTSKLYWFDYNTLSWNSDEKDYIPQLTSPVITTDKTPLIFRKSDNIVHLFGNIDISGVENNLNKEFEICSIPEDLKPNIKEEEYYCIYIPKWTIKVYDEIITIENNDANNCSNIININGNYPI